MKQALVVIIAAGVIIHPAVKKNIDNEDILRAIAYYDLRQIQ